MGVVDDQYVLCKAAVIFAVTRWFFPLAFNFLTASQTLFSISPANLKMMSETVSVTTLGNMLCEDMSCAVCLNRMEKSSKVWKLVNCSHVFHKECLDRWLSYDSRISCPLCRACLLPERSPEQSGSRPEAQSWAVEQMMYLFGDDVL